MSSRASSRFTLALTLVLLVGGAACGWQRWQTTLLRDDLALQKIAAEELERLSAENARLKDRQVSAAELETLRADHAAVVRLRAEIEALDRAAPGK